MSKVLLVDDEFNVIEGLKRQMLKFHPDCHCTGAISGKEALDKVSKDEFDVILLDIRMPEMSGIELLKLLKQNTKTEHIPVIMLTGCSEIELKREALELGAYDFINKPADTVELMARMKSAMNIKNYEDQLRNQNNILEKQLIQSQKMELMGLLANSVAHDLNNILCIIAGNAELVVEDIKSIPDAQDKLEAVLKSCYHGGSLVKQILWLGRGADSECKPYDLIKIIDESLGLLKVLIPKSVNVIWDSQNKEAIAKVHQTQMIQVLMNLITNAIHAMDNTGAITLSLDSQSDVTMNENEKLSGKFHCISISDTGKGMDQETLDHIFDAFYTTKVKGKGTGIGLSVVNRIVSAFSGFIKVDSVPNAGTTFKVYLPEQSKSDNVVKDSELINVTSFSISL